MPFCKLLQEACFPSIHFEFTNLDDVYSEKTWYASGNIPLSMQNNASSCNTAYAIL